MRLTAPAMARSDCAVAQTFAGHMNRDEGGRAGGIDGDAWSAEVQQIGDAICRDAVRVARAQIGVNYL